MTHQSIIFMHIPKAAGSTLKSILWRQYGNKAVYDFRAPQMKDDIARFHALTDAEKTRCRAYEGHLPLGLHRDIPGPSCYISLVRDPEQRIRSAYRHIMSRPIHPQHEVFTKRGVTFVDYVEILAEKRQTNLQTFWLSGLLGTYDAERDFTLQEHDDAEILALAKRNIRDFFGVIAPIERFNDFLICAHRQLGWKLLPYSRVNEGAPNGDFSIKEPHPDIDTLVRLDREIVAFSASVLDETLAGLGRSDLERMQLDVMNYAYRSLKTMRTKMRGWKGKQ